MISLSLALKDILLPFQLSTPALQEISAAFRNEMLVGLEGDESSLKMLPSFLQTPDGSEKGRFISLDFGGTNIRILKTELLGNGDLRLLDRCSKPLRNPAGHYDYLSKQADGEALFDFIAAQIAALVEPEQPYALGHTFSFPLRQTGLNSGLLLHWTKEIETIGVVGKEITALLQAALRRQNLPQLKPVVILNDTVGTLIASAYANQAADIGSICGTGHNTAYLEKNHRFGKTPMIINMESGNFNRLPFSPADTALDAASEQPGSGRLEKMVSGRYLGELLRLLACSLTSSGLLSESGDAALLQTPGLFSSEDVSVLLADDSSDAAEIRQLLNSLHLRQSTLEDRLAFRSLARAIVARSAALVAATYAGILQHIDPTLERRHHIAIDGSLYEKMPDYAASLEKNLFALFPAKAINLSLGLSKDGSGIGAAIATAIAVRQSLPDQ